MHADATTYSRESKKLAALGDSSDIKLIDIQFSATDILRKQGICVDGSQVGSNNFNYFLFLEADIFLQTMLQKIIWNHDECLLNLQHLSLSSRYHLLMTS